MADTTNKEARPVTGDLDTTRGGFGIGTFGHARFSDAGTSGRRQTKEARTAATQTAEARPSTTFTSEALTQMV